jgi:hypothetical protein
MSSGSSDATPGGHHEHQDDADVTGTWQLTIRTPIGRQDVTVDIQTHAAVLAGQARSSAESVPLKNLTVQGQRLSWDQSITRPMRLNLHFDVTITGDDLTGVRAGPLPSSRVTGHRVGRREGGLS